MDSALAIEDMFVELVAQLECLMTVSADGSSD
jgi:hypothetical protein